MTSTPSTPITSSQEPSPGTFVVGAAFITLTLLAAIIVGGLGGAGSLAGAAWTIPETLLRAGWMPAMVCMSALGVGSQLRAWAPPGPIVRGVCGLGGILSAWVLIGWLVGATPLTAWITLSPGLVLFALAAWRLRSRSPLEVLAVSGTSSWWWLAAAPPAGVLLACACVPPGWLWSSEAGGYDVLSYHLALPQQWILEGSMRPVQNNVYSYLPGYAEAGYTLLSLLSAPDRTLTSDGFATGILDRSGSGIFAAQLAHALLTLVATVLVGKIAQELTRRGGAGEEVSRITAAIGAAAFLATPWTIVLGSLAYNEMGVITFGAAAILTALQGRGTAFHRWMLSAMLVGIAASFKPTAILLCAVPFAIALIATTPKAQLPRSIIAGVLVGLATLSPWLARNAVHSGNPVFPFAATIFPNADGGTGHYSKEQSQRFAHAHREHAPIGERLKLLVLPQAPIQEGPAQLSTHRGMLHPQWASLFLSGIVGMMLAIILRTGPSRMISLALVVSLFAGLAAWVLGTHVQSRFLAPLAPLAVLGTSIGLAAIRNPNARDALAVLALGLQLLPLYNTLAAERGGAPMRPLIVGTGAMTGEPLAAQALTKDWPLEKELAPWAWINLRIPPSLHVLLLGEATPLYLRGHTTSFTTWDNHPLARAISAFPDNPIAWSESLRGDGYSLVLINSSELERLTRSGYLDPRLSQASLMRWVQEACVIIREWEDAGNLLVRPLTKEDRDTLIEQMRQQAPQLPELQPPAGG